MDALNPLFRRPDRDAFVPGFLPMSDLLDRFFGEGPRLTTRVGFVPTLDVVQGEKEVVVSAELPGMSSDAIDVKVDGDLLTIAGEKKDGLERGDGQGHYSERRYGTFSRSVRLPPALDADNVSAAYEHGVLTVRIPRVPEVTPRKIEIR